jgi:hypothetical protein
VLVSAVTATGTAPISDYYLSWHLLLRGVALEQIRGDRVLQEALVVRADPLHLAAMFIHAEHAGNWGAKYAGSEHAVVDGGVAGGVVG